MYTNLGYVCFSWPTAKEKRKRETCISDEFECSFVSEGQERMLRVVDTTPFYYVDDVGVVEFYIINSSSKTTRRMPGGIGCMPFAESGEPLNIITLSFFFYEGQIYLIEDMEGVNEYTLMKITSDNPEQDWQWLQSTLVGRKSGAGA